MSSSGPTESSTPISGGCDGSTIRSAISKSMKDEDADSSPFQEGDKVLAFHGPCLYDAKVQKVEFHLDEWRYYVHYHGWNKHWDEWLDVGSLLRRTDKNVQKQKELKEKHAVEKNAKPGRPSQDKTKTSVGTRGRKRKHEPVDKECIVPVEKLVNVQIPSTLKKQLVDDHELITHLGKLVKLPRSPSVVVILERYFDYQEKKDGFIIGATKEIIDGLHSYFDKALPAMLLYKQEREQYKEVIVDNVSPSQVYGAEHLLRLFVKLPELLSCMRIETRALADLQKRLLDFLRFLQNNQNVFFHSKSEGFVDAIKKEDNQEWQSV